MFKKYVLCTNGLVDGVSEYNIYTVEDMINEYKKTYYGIYDDYGIYNMFSADRFILVTDKLINNIVDLKEGNYEIKSGR